MEIFMKTFYRKAFLSIVLLLSLTLIFLGGCDAGNESGAVIHSPVHRTEQSNLIETAQQPMQSTVSNATDSRISQKSIRQQPTTVVDRRLADLALEIASTTIKLTTEIQGTIDYDDLSRGWNHAQVLGYVYQNDVKLREIFSPLFVEIASADFGVVVRIYTKDKAVLLVEDYSETSRVDRIYGR